MVDCGLTTILAIFIHMFEIRRVTRSTARIIKCIRRSRLIFILLVIFIEEVFAVLIMYIITRIRSSRLSFILLVMSIEEVFVVVLVIKMIGRVSSTATIIIY